MPGPKFSSIVTAMQLPTGTGTEHGSNNDSGSAALVVVRLQRRSFFDQNYSIDGNLLLVDTL